ncbi:Protein glass [Gryllus bimaculatus]|nr:Protein glass [Gryllus bimaculatus]
MDEIAVPISWFRQSEGQDSLAVDPVYVRDGELTTATDPTLQGNKQSPTVAVYLLQFYPVTQACVQPCVTTTSNGHQLTTSAVIPQVSIQQPTINGSCFVSQASQVCPTNQNVDAISLEGKPTTLKLEPLCLFAEQQEIKQTNQCLATQDNLVPTCKVPLVQKWKDEGNTREHPITIVTTGPQENSVHLQQTNQATQVTSGTLSVHSVSNSNPTYSTETFHTIDHVVRTQPGEKPYSCNVCGKVFARAHNLKAHSQTHSGALPFPCKICRKSYSQEAYYRIHSEILSGGRPYTCEVCSKVFCNSRSFNFHVRSHSRRKCIT